MEVFAGFLYILSEVRGQEVGELGGCRLYENRKVMGEI
jgi:hypothetical protein